MIDLDKSNYYIECIDGAQGLSKLCDHSVKLIYGSPPYPNAIRNYGNWTSSDYIEKMTPFIDESINKLSKDGFLIINVKANREKHSNGCTTRSLVVEKLAVKMEEDWGLYCVDIEMWLKTNPVPTGLRVACQDSYEQILWFSVNPKWKINLDAIRRPYSESTEKIYSKYEYKPRNNGLTYVRKAKKLTINENGAMPINTVIGSISSNKTKHQAVQPQYLPEKYILATTLPGDIIVDPWMGSGTTGIVALNNRRKFVGFDINQDCFNIAKPIIMGANYE